MVSGTLRSGMPHCIPLQSVTLQWKVLKRTLWMREFLWNEESPVNIKEIIILSYLLLEYNCIENHALIIQNQCFLLFDSDPRERLKEDDLDVILSPQRRSFGGGCQGNAALAPHARRPNSPLENKENETLRLGTARRIGSGRIIAARSFERDARVEKERERDRDLKDKRFRVGPHNFQSVHNIFSLWLRQQDVLYWCWNVLHC